jgi:hypothetical protein
MPRSRITVETQVNVRGPLFEGRDKPIMRKFNEDAKQLVAKAGEQQIRERVTRRAKHPSGKPGGHFAAAIVTKDYKKGRTITAEYPQILRGPWLEGSSTRNASTRFKGWRMFRLTRTWLRRNYMKLIQDLLDKAVAELNGGPR